MSTATLKKTFETTGGELKAARRELQAYFEKVGADGTIDVDAAGLDSMKVLEKKIEDLTPKFARAKGDFMKALENEQKLAELDEAIIPANFHAGRVRGGDDTDLGRAIKQLGDLFVGGKGYQAYLKSLQGGDAEPKFRDELVEANLKTLFQRTAGWSPFVAREPGYVPFAQQQPKIIDAIPMVTTTQSAVRWMTHTLNTNNAAMTPEAGQLAESAYQLSETIFPVQKIGHFVPVTEEQLADVPGTRDFLNVQLELGCKQAAEKQILNGDGTGSNLTGFYKTAGLQTQKQGTDLVQDAIYKAMTLVQVQAFADPTAIWINPLDWQNIRLQKTTQGVYYYGSPDQVGLTRMWGLPLLTSTYVPLGTPLVGDFSMYSNLHMRAGVSIDVSNSHADFFIKDILAIKATMRLALIITRAAAFAQVLIGQ